MSSPPTSFLGFSCDQKLRYDLEWPYWDKPLRAPPNEVNSEIYLLACLIACLIACLYVCPNPLCGYTV